MTTTTTTTDRAAFLSLVSRHKAAMAKSARYEKQGLSSGRVQAHHDEAGRLDRELARAVLDLDPRLSAPRDETIRWTGFGVVVGGTAYLVTPPSGWWAVGIEGADEIMRDYDPDVRVLGPKSMVRID
jgi:hypothetical protein